MTADQVIKHFKGVRAAASALGYHRQTIYDWQRNGISKRIQQFIELKTAGALRAAKK